MSTSFKNSSEGVFKHSSGDLSYEKVGDGSVAVLFLNGLGLSRTTWYDIVDRFSVPNCQLVIPDLLGCGASHPSSGFPFTVAEHATVLLDFINYLALKNVAIVGHSYGGGIALAMAMNDNHEASRHIRSLILIDTMCYPQPKPFFIWWLTLPFLGNLGLNIIPVTVRIDLLFPDFFYNVAVITPELKERYKKSLDGKQKNQYLVRAAKNLFTAENFKIFADYSRIQKKTLIIWGENDKIIPLALGERLHLKFRPPS